MGQTWIHCRSYYAVKISVKFKFSRNLSQYCQITSETNADNLVFVIFIVFSLNVNTNFWVSTETSSLHGSWRYLNVATFQYFTKVFSQRHFWISWIYNYFNEYFSTETRVASCYFFAVQCSNYWFWHKWPDNIGTKRPFKLHLYKRWNYHWHNWKNHCIDSPRFAPPK